MGNLRQLITVSLQQKDIVSLLNFPDALLEKFEKEQITWIGEYSVKFGETPNLERFEDDFSLFVREDSKNPLLDIYEQCLVNRKNLYARKRLMEVQDDLKDGCDPTPYLQEMLSVCQQGEADIVKYTTFDRSEYYKERTKIPFDVPILDRATGGMQEGDLIYIIGRLGTGKSTFCLWLVSKWVQHGLKILAIPNESRHLSVIGKVDAALAGFNPAKIRTQEFTEDEKDRIQVLSNVLKYSSGEIYIPKKPINEVAHIDALIKKHNPDLVFIDGAYLMGQGGRQATWERITAVSRNLKTVALENNTPIFGIHQSKRNQSNNRIEAEDAAYSDAIGQDADILLSISKEEDGKLLIDTPKNRDNKRVSFFIEFFFEDMSTKVYGAV